MHYSQEFIELKLQAIRESLNRPVAREVKVIKKPISAHMARLKGTIEERRAEQERKDQLKRERAEAAAKLILEKAKRKEQAKLLATEQKRQARAEKERQRLLNESEDKKKVPTRIIDYSQMKICRIDAKTQIYIPLDQDPEEARNNWLEKHRSTETKKQVDNDLPPVYQF